MVLTLVFSGFLVGGIYLFLQNRQTQLTTQHDSQFTLVSQDAAKEGLLGALKGRAAVIDKIMATQKKTDALFDLVNSVVPQGSLIGLSLDDSNKAVIDTQVRTLQDAVVMVDSLLRLGNEGKLTKPELLSLALSKQGGFEILLAFVPTL